MSPRPEITPAPRLPVQPRQTDTYDYSSIYAELSSVYPDLYSSYSFDSAYFESLLSEYSALASAYSYSVPDYYSYLSATGTAAAARSSAVRSGQATSTSISSGGSDNKGGLSTGAKIGIGVGVPLVVGLLVGLGVFLWCAGKNRGKKTSTTIVAPQSFQPQPPQPQVQPQMGYVNNQGYMQGYQQQGGVQMPTVTPPPHYTQPQDPVLVQPGAHTDVYAGYAKGPEPGVIEMEQEYHFARPGVVEMGDGSPEEQTGQRKKKGWIGRS